MRFLVMVLFLLFSAPALAQENVPEIPFDSIPDPVRLPPDMYLGEVAGVAVNSRGHIFIFHRHNPIGPAYGATAAQLLEFDENGSFLREIGKGLYAFAYAHTVRIDPNDNIWVTDKGSDMIVELNPDGRVMMVFGRKKEASDVEAHGWERVNPPLPPIDQRFREPTDVTWDPEGNIYISDGYVNARVAKFDKEGFWLDSFGEPGSGPGQFNTVHSIASDRNGNIYVADRGNRRIQVLDRNGNVERIIQINVPVPADAHAAIGSIPEGNELNGTQGPGAPWAVCVSPGETQYLFVADAYPGRVYKLTLDGTVVGMLGESGRQMKQFGWIHEIACPSENELIVAELLNWRIQHLILH
jgi:hypothetical protein